ncbi:ATP-binding protein [Chloroflexota bacterium]
MNKIELFPKDKLAGVFRGFREGGLEFHADLVLPYQNRFQSLPMHGQFLLVQLENPEEAVLGRITSFSSEGKLTSSSGEEFNIRAAREDREIPEDLREQYLKYRINIRVLGVVRNSDNGKLTFAPSHRRLPHVGSRVAFLSDDVLKEIAGHNEVGAAIGHYALGEYLYSGKNEEISSEDWMQLISPEVQINFPIDSLVSRRSFIFARAGFGKSNLNKLLFSKLYEKTPTTTKRGNVQVPVGTVIFDPDGEYYWPDDKGRPGLCDVPALEENLVVFTSKNSTSPFYQSFVAGGIKLDIRRLRPSDIIAIALGPERQDQQNVRKLRGLSQEKWEELVNLIDKNKNQTDLSDVSRILDLAPQQEAEALAARANMTAIVNMLHDKSSQLMDMLITALSKGKLCVIDVSQLRGSQSLVLSGLILRRIFDRNQQEFTSAEPRTIPTIAVIEEAQSVLNEKATSAEPFIAWVKEGRKYDLGSVMVTQQPGSIPTEILSQGDNWFIFHLLSSTDLTNVKRANAHFSDDLLSVLLNEPIPGNGVFWSSVSGKPYPIPIRILSFEKKYPVLDKEYKKQPAKTFALELKKEYQHMIIGDSPITDLTKQQGGEPETEIDQEEEGTDALQIIEDRAIEELRNDDELLCEIREEGIAWGKLKAYFKKILPEGLEDTEERAFHLVPKAMNTIFGSQNIKWHTYKSEKGATYVKAGINEE